MKGKPIHIFWSDLSHRFYVSRHYKEISPGNVLITGEMFDVTDELSALVAKYQIKFKPAIVCPRCGRTSYHPEDVRQRYCGNCHQFHADMDQVG